MHTLRNGCGGLDFFQVSIKNYSSKCQKYNLHYIILINNYAPDGSMVKKKGNEIAFLQYMVMLPGNLMDAVQILMELLSHQKLFL